MTTPHSAPHSAPAGRGTPETEPSTKAGRRLVDWTWLANVVRHIDGNHDLGAGEFAEKLVIQITPFVRLAEREAREEAAGQVAALPRYSITSKTPSRMQETELGRWLQRSAVLDLLSALPAAPVRRETPGLDVERLAVALEDAAQANMLAFDITPADLPYVAERITAEYLRLAAAERPDEAAR